MRWLLFAAVPLVLAVLALAFFHFHSARDASDSTLFIIQRSLNANKVHDDAQVGADGAQARDPVVACGIMKAEGGSRDAEGALRRFLWRSGGRP